MSAKASTARRRAFFAALAETGNQTLAAERAKVSRSWMSLHRAADPAFRDAMDAAVAAARERLNEAATGGATGRWRDHDGVELTVRRSNGRWAQVARTRLRQWTPRLEARFLRALAERCNVKAACRLVGLSVASAYGHRKRWAGFAERWDRAIQEGYDRLSFALIASARAMLGDEDMAPDPDMGPITADQAIAFLRLHHARANRRPRPPGRPTGVATVEEVRAVIFRKVEIIKRAEAAAMRKGE